MTSNKVLPHEKPVLQISAFNLPRSQAVNTVLLLIGGDVVCFNGYILDWTLDLNDTTELVQHNLFMIVLSN